MPDGPELNPMLTPLDYADARNVRPMSVLAAKWTAGLSAVPTVVGVGTLVLYYFTGNETLPGFGFMWLGIGGLLAFSIGVTAVVNLIRAVSRKPRERAVIDPYTNAIVGCLVAVVAAFLCARIGADLIDRPHFRMTVKNDTSTPLDRVTVHFTSGDVVVGPIAPGRRLQTGLIWPTHQHAPLEITTVANGRTRRKIDRAELSLWRGHGSLTSFEVTVEPAELPKGLK